MTLTQGTNVLLGDDPVVIAGHPALAAAVHAVRHPALGRPRAASALPRCSSRPLWRPVRQRQRHLAAATATATASATYPKAEGRSGRLAHAGVMLAYRRRRTPTRMLVAGAISVLACLVPAARGGQHAVRLVAAGRRTRPEGARHLRQPKPRPARRHAVRRRPRSHLGPGPPLGTRAQLRRRRLRPDPELAELSPQRLTVSLWFKGDGSPGTYRYLISKGGDACVSASSRGSRPAPTAASGSTSGTASSSAGRAAPTSRSGTAAGTTPPAPSTA